MDMEKSDVTRKIASKKALGINSPKVNGDALQQGGGLDGKLNHDKPHWSILVTSPGVSCQKNCSAIGENIISQVKVCILCNVNLCVKHLVIFHTSLTLLEDR